MALYLIRHAETPPRPGKPSDGDATGLAPAGHVEAAKKGAWFKKRGVTTLITSPLARTKDTADELAKESGAQVVIDERAKEFVAADVGPPDFKPMREKARREREWVGERGESFNASVARLTALLDSVANDGTTAIVTHELLLQNFLMSLGATPPHIEHLSVITVEKGANGWKVVSISPGRSFWHKIARRIFG